MRLFLFSLFPDCAGYEFFDLDNRDYRNGERDGYTEFREADRLKSERGGERGNKYDGGSQNEREEHRPPEPEILFSEREYRMFARAHIERVEDLDERERQERHCHSVGACRYFPSAGFHKMSDEIRDKRQRRDKKALNGNACAEPVREDHVL